MALSVQTQAKYWGIAAAIVVTALWFLGDVILPFVLGGAIAYCLDPVADALERLGMRRSFAVAAIAIISVILFVVILLPAVSLVIGQANELAQTWPDLVERLQVWLQTTFPSLMDDSSQIRQQLANLLQRLSDSAGDLLSNVVSSAAGIVNIIVLLVIVPVVAFYLLLDWDRMVARVDQLLPRDHAPVIRKLMHDMDRTLASFIRGQGLVCLIMGLFYAVALLLAGLNFGFVIGAVAGLVTFIPYVGAIIGGVLAVGLAIFQTWNESGADASLAEGAARSVNWWYILLIAAIFQAGQFVEGNILTPKLVGGSVGLHPVTLLFALSLFGALFGFVGLLVAVPIAAMIGVLVRFGVEQYTDSRLYQGRSGGSRTASSDDQ